MFRMTVEDRFSAAHFIRGYQGPCCRLHGHNYRVVVRLAGDELDALGMLIDYGEVKRALAEVLAPFDHAHLNEQPEFAEVNPTCEELSRLLYHRLQDALAAHPRVRVMEVIVYENEKQGVGYGEE